MRPVLRFFVMVIILPVLSACSAGEWFSSSAPWMGRTDDTSVTVSSPATAIGTPETDARFNRVPGVIPVPPARKPTEDELYTIANQTQRGKVQIYQPDDGMDGMGVPAPYIPDRPMASGGAGIPAAADSRVTIYPIDDMGTYDQGGPYTGSYNAASAYGGSGVFYEGNTGAGVPQYSGPIEGQKQSREGNPSRIYFGHGSARLDGTDRAVLSAVAEKAKFAPVDRISIEGHASSRVQTRDPVQGRILNLKQSMNRAVAVSNSLIQSGVPPEKIKTTSWGDTRPPMDGSEAEARRVDIHTGGGY